MEAWAAAGAQGNAISSYSGSDALTRLPSGQPLLDQLTGALEDASSAGGAVSVIQIDIDGFGSANVEFGSAACDEMLQTLASSLEHQFGEKATVGRLWSDEFLIILAKTRSEDAAFAAEAARRAIQEQESPEGPISLSIGVATYPLHSGDAGGLLRKAREARYLSQQDGGGRTRVAEADQMVTKTSHFSKIQLKRLSALARAQDRSEAAVLREGLDAVLALYEDSATGLLLLLPKS
jgi:diguanylate cyclase (GGDEF)-like protein